MIFNSLEFLVFLPVFLALYFSCRGMARILVCLVGSYVFYGWWDPRFLSLIVFSTVVDYCIGVRLSSEVRPRVRKALLVTSLVVNLGLLGVFKYFDFFVDSAIEALTALGFHADPFTLNIILPVGISFYTFQTLSYSIDVYRGTLEPERSFPRFAAYVAFFPQLVAGPIVRASHLLPQFREDRSPSWADLTMGWQLILLGLFKKVVIADSAAPLVDAVFRNPELFTSLNVLIGVYLYAVQIYCDFSGYSDIAIGIGKILGYDFPKNFDKPYFSASFSEFWKRWHISLSSWLRDYLYIPLGGNRKGSVRTQANLMTTMLLGGLWHGAAWTFVVWGALHGLYLVLQRVLGGPYARLARALRVPGWVSRVFLVVLVFHLTCFAWVFFRAQSFEEAIVILGRIASLDSFNPLGLKKIVALAQVVLISLVFIGCELLGVFVPLRHWVATRRVALILWSGALLWGIALFGNFSGNQFIYFQF